MPNFEVLDARIASALNKIIHNSHVKRRIISLEEQKAQKQVPRCRGGALGMGQAWSAVLLTSGV